VDTVARAPGRPGQPQPFAELGLTRDEYEKIVATLGRRPTGAELALYSVMWSEHCSYKSSKVHLRQFAAKAPPSSALLAGIGHNAGVVDIGRGYAVTFKIESHNHPSYVEPHQGAATGVCGIVRDILAMGARAVAVMDALRFGPADAPDTGRLVMTWHGETVVDIPPASAADGPVYHRPLAQPASQDALAAGDPAALPAWRTAQGLRADLLALLGSLGLPRPTGTWRRPVRARWP
jgi:phosphoribosylformylglycinamidine (FGAM) synthase-like enzyme